MLNDLKKIVLILKKIFKKEIKINYGIPKDLQLVVYNSYSMNQLKFAIEDKKFIVIDLRLVQLKNIYISLNLILRIFLNLFRFKLSTNYFYSILTIINPPVVLTTCDNHKDFFEISRLLEKKIKFIAIQNANRTDYERNDHDYKKKISLENLNKDFFIPNFFCFGQNEIDNCNFYNINVSKFKKIGSINTSNFFYYLKKHQKELKKEKFDICLISEPALGDNQRYLENNVEEGFGLIANYTVKFARKSNSKFVFASKRFKNSKFYPKDLFTEEMNFYKKYLNNSDFNYLMENLNPKENSFSSYFAIFQSKVAIATQSTLLRDKIGVGEKILSCNLTKFKLHDFPINGICKINDCSYEQFEERLSKIMNISTKEYFEKIDKNKNYVMEFKNQFGALEEIKKELI